MPMAGRTSTGLPWWHWVGTCALAESLGMTAAAGAAKAADAVGHGPLASAWWSLVGWSRAPPLASCRQPHWSGSCPRWTVGAGWA